MNNNRFSIGKVHINITSTEHTQRKIREAVDAGVNGYICVSNMRTVSLANKDEQYCEVMRNSYMNIPDGMPLVWCGRLWGCKDAQRSSGPDLFVKMLDEADPKYRHFLLGDTDETLAKMKARFPNANIVGTYSPPFKPLEEYDMELLAKMIDDSGANIVWTSLTAPKQDFLGSMISEHTHNKLFVGVGAAFRFSLGETNIPPEWVRKLGITGLWLRPNKFKTGWWYFRTSFSLMHRLLQIEWRKVIGMTCYE